MLALIRQQIITKRRTRFTGPGCPEYEWNRLARDIMRSRGRWGLVFPR